MACFAIGMMTAGCTTASNNDSQAEPSEAVQTCKIAGTMDEPLASEMNPDVLPLELERIADFADERGNHAMRNDKTGDLLLTTSAMSGTGVRVEWLYLIGYDEVGTAYVKAEINPYDVQQALLQRLDYTIEGDTIALFDGDKLLAKAVNTIKDMGGFDEEAPLWIGEQLFYDLSGDEPMLVFIPGVNFTTGLVLLYDDMPTLSASISIDENGKLTIREIGSTCTAM